MKSSSESGEQVSATDRVQIDELCDSFEAEWQRQAFPKIESFLSEVDPRLRASLLNELIQIDHHWRTEVADATVIRDEYFQRFPEDTDVIQSVLGDSSDDQSAPMLLSSRSSLGPFINMERIGEGGFGVVFRAWDSRHRREVALKIPRFGHEVSADDLNRFLREAKAAGSLDHPGIARVWGSGTISGVTYIAYQFIEGENLKVRLDDIANRTPAEIVRFVRQLAEAVHFAHEHGIIHRDIKPSNILLTSDDRPVLTDFGLALTTGADATRSIAGRVGTLDYMSPEQARGGSHYVDGRADLWSLGVLTYQLLTKTVPFVAASDVELLRTIQQDEPKRMLSIRKDVPLDVDVLVTRCLQKRSRDRLPTCGFFAAELERVERGEPILSRPVSFIERTIRWCARNMRVVAAFSVLTLATIFGTWSWAGWFFANKENKSVVKVLNIQMEAGNVLRREIIGDFLEDEVTGMNLRGNDLRYVESRFYTTDDPAVRHRAAKVLLKHDSFGPVALPSDDVRIERCMALLQMVIDDPQTKEELKAKLQKAAESLAERQETPATPDSGN